MAALNWTCPHCDRPQTLTDKQRCLQNAELFPVEGKHGVPCYTISAVSCANPQCKELTVDVTLFRGGYATNSNAYIRGDKLSMERIRPRSKAKHWPEFVPLAIRQDYEEACLVVDLSPKAAATLCRRALQGMIRDFCGIARGTLDQEIKELRKLVDDGNAPKGVEPETIDAIDAVRAVGNIGAHMEKDVNIIVPVEANETKLLVELIELLITDWYVARNAREQRLANVKALAAEKKEQKKTSGAPAKATDAGEAK